MGRVYVCSVVTVSQLLTANGGLYWQERTQREPTLLLYIHILFLSCKATINMFRFQHFSLERLTYEQNQFLNPAMCMYTWVISRVQICNGQLYHPSATSFTTYDQQVLSLPYMGSNHPVLARSSLPTSHGMLFLFPTLSS